MASVYRGARWMLSSFLGPCLVSIRRHRYPFDEVFSLATQLSCEGYLRVDPCAPKHYCVDVGCIIRPTAL